MEETIYIGVVAGFLLISALFHLFLPNLTTQWMTRPLAVRAVGALLLLLSLPSLKWQGTYFWTLFAGLAISGIWRLFFPRNSIRAQERSYPRWVHGCLLLAGSIAVWILRP
jgi:hypothetical protein